jgi:hypothetical protein
VDRVFGIEVPEQRLAGVGLAELRVSDNDGGSNSMWAVVLPGVFLKLK